MEPLLKVSHLSITFGGLTAVDDVSLTIQPGQIVGLIGPNGAGKTTVFNLITGVYQPTGGEIIFQGQNIVGMETHHIAKMGVVRTFQNIRLFKKLSVLDNVRAAYQTHASYHLADAIFKTGRFSRDEQKIIQDSKSLLEMVGLADRLQAAAGSLPYGLQRRLEIARALALTPKLLLLDEPAAGMNPAECAELVDFIRTLKKQMNLTVLIIEHHMEVAMNLCEYLFVLNFGKLLFEGTPLEVQGNPRVIEAYLGVEDEEEAV